MDTTKLVTLATQPIDDPNDVYVVVDFLNRTLKDRGLVFGLSKGEEDSRLQITVYEERES
ncbi:MAG: YpmA family protein [Tumebacillaceae bacterium]